MKKPIALLLGSLLLLHSCSPKITSTITKAYETLDYKEEVKVLLLYDPIPAGAEELGSIKAGDTGFTAYCTFSMIIETLQLEARKVGGNAIKITQHLLPGMKGSDCHQMTVKVLKINDFNTIPRIYTLDSALAKADYSLFHIYRPVSGFLGYNIMWSDSAICHLGKNGTKTLHVHQTGVDTLWAETETINGIPMNIQKGKEYFVRCNNVTTYNPFYPLVQLIHPEVGREEYLAIKMRNEPYADKIVLNDGKTIDCVVLSEDDKNVNYTIIENKESVYVQLPKSGVKQIVKEEL